MALAENECVSSHCKAPAACAYCLRDSHLQLPYLAAAGLPVNAGPVCRASEGEIRQVMVRGLARVDQMFVLTMAAYNLTRMRTLGQIRLRAQ